MKQYVREATIEDLDGLVDIRCKFLNVMERAEVPDLPIVTRAWLEQHIKNGTFKAWIADVDGQIVCCSGLMIVDYPPGYMASSDGQEGYILNIFTLPEWRGKGLASLIMEEIVNYMRKHKINRATLHTTEEARALYERHGFRATHTEMEWLLEA